MRREQMKQHVRAATLESNDEVLEAYIQTAEAAVMQRRDPYGWKEGDPVPYKWNALVGEIAIYLLNKRGAEGETSHSEDGISRSYESATVPESMLKGIMPLLRVIGTGNDGSDDDADSTP